MRRILWPDHLLVQLLAGADADNLVRRLRRHHAGDVGDLHRGDLAHIDLATLHVLQRMPDQFNALFERDHEAGHAAVGDRQHPLVALAGKERNDRPARAHDIAIAHHGKPRAMLTAIGIGGHEQLVRGQLRGTVKVDRAGGLVGGQRHHPLDAAVNRRVNDIHRAVDIGLDAFKGVVFGGRYNLGGRRVDHIIHPAKGAVQAVTVAHIADEKAHPVIAAEKLGHFPLLHLVAAEDDQLARIVALQCHGHKGMPERAGAAGDKKGGILQHQSDVPETDCALSRPARG